MHNGLKPSAPGLHMCVYVSIYEFMHASKSAHAVIIEALHGMTHGFVYVCKNVGNYSLKGAHVIRIEALRGKAHAVDAALYRYVGM
jgi:hypothetical protein